MTIKFYNNEIEKKAFLKFINNSEWDGLVAVDPKTPEELETLLQNYMTAYAEGLSVYLFPVKYWPFLRALERNFDEGYYKRTYKPTEMLTKAKKIIRDCIGTIFGSENEMEIKRMAAKEKLYDIVEKLDVDDFFKIDLQDWLNNNYNL